MLSSATYWIWLIHFGVTASRRMSTRLLPSSCVTARVAAPDHRLNEGGPAAEGTDRGGNPFGAEKPLLGGVDERPRQRVVGEHGGADLDRGLRVADAWRADGEQRHRRRRQKLAS